MAIRARGPTAVSDERWHVRAVALPGGDEPTDLWIADGRLTDAPVDGARDLPGAFVAPGLVDAHVHLTFEARGRLGLERGSPELIAAHLDLHRRAGVLAVRDAGSLPGIALEPETASGVRIVACGPFLAPPGLFLEHLYDATLPEDAVDVARRRIRDGRPWAKIIADHPGPNGNPLAPRLGYSFDLVAEIAAAVHAEGGRLAVHVMGDIVREVVEAGVDSVEHGNWADANVVREMAARGTAWCPTLTTVLHHIEPVADRLAAARALLDRQRETLPLAAELGVTLLAGTDEEPHGSVADEVGALVRHGVPPRAALDAATTGARDYLGLPGLEPGAPADLVTFERDPRDDVHVLGAPAAILAGGRRIDPAGAAA
jgi:imidazolonepropionase-like amidohydrolase